MPIYRGSKQITSRYRGNNKLAKQYRGTNLVYQSVTADKNIVALLNRTITNCDDLLGDEITSIPDYMFEYCKKLESITIPKNVTSLGAYALAGCTSLKIIRLLPTTPPTFGSYLMNYNTSPERIECPASSYEAYSTASGWSNYVESGVLVGV